MKNIFNLKSIIKQHYSFSSNVANNISKCTSPCKKIYRSTFLLLFVMLIGCDDFLDENPVDSLTDATAITDLAQAESAMVGLYKVFDGFGVSDGRLNSMSDVQNGTLPGDDYTLNTVQPETSGLIGFWSRHWELVERANNIIDKIPVVNTLTIDQKNQFVGEAKAIMAFAHLHAMQLWGKIPWVESTDFRINQDLSRISTEEVYTNIISELLEAEQGLPVSYPDANDTRTRITKGAATALLARAYLYAKNWAEAESKASEVITNSLYQLETEYENVFSKTSVESILEMRSDAFTNAGVGRFYFPVSLGGTYTYKPTDKIENAFENGDLRKPITLATDIEGLLYVNKYKDVDNAGAFQEIKVLRVAEMYLIRAEARVQQQNIPGAAEDLNMIRNRAGLLNTTANDQASILAAIEQERFVELCFEGHRWIDLVRTERVDEVMSVINPTTWQSRAKLLPIPQAEIDLNPNLIQNFGY